MAKTGIYKITSPSNKIYIGQSINIELRWNKDYKKLRCKSQRKLYFSLKKYGVENHKFEIIELCSEEQLLEKETYWKNFYRVLEIPSLCCKIDGKGGKSSKETRQRISEGLKGTIRSEETKNKIRKNMLNSKKVYQFTIKGDLVKIWNSIKEAQRGNKGNIKRNILGYTKYANGFIWLREEDKNKIFERVKLIENSIHNNTGKIKTKEQRKNLSKALIGKKSNFKKNKLNLEEIKKQYEYLPLRKLAKLNNVSHFTMTAFLKENNIYEFRKNYMK